MKPFYKNFKYLIAISIALLSLSNIAQATKVKIEVTNLFDDGGLALTPVWAGFHDGTFDTFDLGANASASVQALAENGMVGGVRDDFAMNSTGVDTVITAPAGFAGAPVFEPGESASAVIDINNVDSGYFSFLSMLIPTNDAFIGNADPDRYALFDMLGNFVGLDIVVLGANVWDAGTEVNTGFGSPFLVGAAGSRQDENGVISQHQGLAVVSGGTSIIGGMTPAGYTIDGTAADFTASGFEVARIRITQVSAPAMGFALFAFAGIALVRKRNLSAL